MTMDRASRTQVSKVILAFTSLFTAGIMGCIASTVVAMGLGMFDGNMGMLVAVSAGVVSFPFWISGLFLVGWPVWRFLARRGRRDRKAAQISGGLMAMVSAPLIAWALFTNLSFTVGMQGAIALALIAIPAAAGGVASGWTFWHPYCQGHAS